MSYESFFAFCVAAAALALVPGPTVTVIIANSLRYGSRAGLLNVAGTQAGFVIWLGIAAMGLGAAIKLMGTWFDVLSWAGAAYLVWLGIKMLLSKGDLAVAVDRARPHGSFFLQGFVVIISNPKMLVLFGAMIPPFLSKDGNMMQQTLLLGLTFMVIAAVGDTLYALMAGKAGQWLSRSRIRAIEIVSGVCLTAGGVWMALRGR
ncbi:MAG: LysE family translocator [Rhizobiales bacterium]|jgi:threonine/homoserine/homoserine lactone efflux protein|nr:LysE family translocator [Hyphomicrobiales bacterium]MBP9175295.1 LysE family translocator [Hyphomicrobiales bacterium]